MTASLYLQVSTPGGAALTPRFSGRSALGTTFHEGGCHLICCWASTPNQLRFRADRLAFFAGVLSRFGATFDLTLRFGTPFDFTFRFGFALAFGWSRSGNSAFPAARFHSSKVSGEILPLTSNSANFLRCALLLPRTCVEPDSEDARW